MHHSTTVLIDILIVILAAQLGAEIAQRLKLPSVVGEILAGCVVGPFALNLIHLEGTLEDLAELGAVILLFAVGLETRAEDIRKVGARATLVAILGVVLPFILGLAWARFSGYTTPESVFVAAAFVATSAGITARVLQELKVLDSVESKIILGAAVIDDVLAMLLLGVVTSFQAHGSVSTAGVVWVLLQALLFIGVVLFVGVRIIRSRSTLLDLPQSPFSSLTLSLALCFAIAALSAWIGLAAIIGAFLAGMLIAEAKQHVTIEKGVKPLEVFLVPFFFVVTGAKVDIGQLAHFPTLIAVLVVTILAIFSKVAGCGLGAAQMGKRSALIIGVGMAPRGEVGIIVASLALQASVFSNQLYGIVIIMSLLTSIVTPPLLKRLFALDHAPRRKPSASGL